MNQEYNPHSNKSRSELVASLSLQDKRAINYLTDEILHELTSGDDKKNIKRYHELNNLNQLFPPAFFTKKEQTEWYWLHSAVSKITGGDDIDSISMRLKLENINRN
jgi:hypothetical protein